MQKEGQRQQGQLDSTSAAMSLGGSGKGSTCRTPNPKGFPRNLPAEAACAPRHQAMASRSQRRVGKLNSKAQPR